MSDTDTDNDDETLFVTFNMLVETTLLSKLANNYDDPVKHREFNARRFFMKRNVAKLREFLGTIHIMSHKYTTEMLASLFILSKELSIESAYNPIKAKEYISLLNSDIETVCDVRLDDLLINGEWVNSQSIFDCCMKKLHQKITPAEFKKYPFLIEVYILIVNDIRTYNVTVTLSKTVPISLILIDDYKTEIKCKGLRSCISILQCAEKISFSSGNYHEVIYKCLCKAIKDKDPQVLRLVFECFNEYLKALPNELKKQKTNETLYMILDIIQMDTINRKVKLLNFIKPLMSIDVLKRQKVFESVMVDNLDQCTMESIRNVLLIDLLDCLRLWLKYCWCVWSYSSNYKLLSVLIQVLYAISKYETEALKQVEDLIITMIDLSESKHQKEILQQLDSVSKLNNQIFKERVANIANKFNVSELHKKKF